MAEGEGVFEVAQDPILLGPGRVLQDCIARDLVLQHSPYETAIEGSYWLTFFQ